MNRIKPYNGIHSVQRPVFPTLYLRKDTVGDAADGLGRYAVADGVQAQDSVRQRVGEELLPLAHNLGLEGAVPVPGRVDGYFSH